MNKVSIAIIFASFVLASVVVISFTMDMFTTEIENFSNNTITRLQPDEMFDSRIRICLDCGSAKTVKNEKTIICRDCGNIRFYSN